MTDLEQQLVGLETQMRNLIAARERRILGGKALIERANRDFDRDALCLGKRINALREQIAAAQPKTSTPHQHDSNGKHDPEWTQEDIDHYHYLKRLRASQ